MEVVEAALVRTTIVLVGGQAEAAAPAAQVAGVVERIWTLSGVKVQEAKSGRPEQESVTNIGAVSEPLFTGVIVVTTFPALPAVSDSVVGATET